MLISGFLSEILEKLPEDDLKKFLIEKIEDKLMDVKNIKKEFPIFKQKLMANL